jgi:hypothetical protein
VFEGRIAGPGAVHLVGEDERRDPEQAQGPQQDPGLRLHALDRGHHEHGAVQDVEHPFHSAMKSG